MITAEGLKPDPRKIPAIMNKSQPKDKEAVKILFGMVTYLGKLCSHLSDFTASLCDLMKDVDWVWDAQHAECLRQIKYVVISPTVLKLFYPNEPVTLSAYASQRGLGAVIFQAGQPVEYALCSLSDTQQRYAQLKRNFWQSNSA